MKMGNMLRYKHKRGAISMSYDLSFLPWGEEFLYGPFEPRFG